MQQSKNTESIQDNLEISIQDILDFMGGAWKTVAITVALGVSAAIVYLTLTPPKYEAIAQIRMAQISLSNPANPFGVSVEDPASLIARMEIPTNYDQTSMIVCGFGGKAEPQSLARSLRFSAPKGLANTVELKALGPSPQQAADCAAAVVMQITKLQAQFAQPYVLEAKAKLAQDNERINEARRLIAKADQSGSAMSATYLSARDEINFFLTDREKMLELINSAEQRSTKLISPIYASERAVSPKRSVSIAAGLIAGLFFGLGIALARQFWKMRSKHSSLGVNR